MLGLDPQVQVAIIGAVATVLTAVFSYRAGQRPKAKRKDRSENIFDGYDKLLAKQEAVIGSLERRNEATERVIERLEHDLAETRILLEEARGQLSDARRQNVELRGELSGMRQQMQESA